VRFTQAVGALPLAPGFAPAPGPERVHPLPFVGCQIFHVGRRRPRPDELFQVPFDIATGPVGWLVDNAKPNGNQTNQQDGKDDDDYVFP